MPSLYQIGAESKALVQEHREEINAFRYPPESYRDIYKAQKYYYEAKLGRLGFDKSEQAIPQMSFSDIAKVYDYWKDVSINHVKNSTVRARIRRVAMAIDDAMLLLFGKKPTPNEVAKFFGSGLSNNKFFAMEECTKFWLNIGFIAAELDNIKAVPPQGSLGKAWDSFTESAEELPERMANIVATGVKLTGRPLAAASGAAGNIIGKFFEALLGSLKTPATILFAFGTIWLGWKGYKEYKSMKMRGWKDKR